MTLSHGCCLSGIKQTRHSLVPYQELRVDGTPCRFCLRPLDGTTAQSIFYLERRGGEEQKQKQRRREEMQSGRRVTRTMWPPRHNRISHRTISRAAAAILFLPNLSVGIFFPDGRSRSWEVFPPSKLIHSATLSHFGLVLCLSFL